MGFGWVSSGHRRRIAPALLGALGAALILSSCGGGDSTNSSVADGSVSGEASTASNSTAESELAEPGSAVSTGIPGKFGRVVVSQVGFTFYSFSKDKKNVGSSACYGKCAKVWKPYLTNSAPTIMQKADEDMLGTFKRKDGFTQVTYGGWPLYTYATEGAAGAAHFGESSFGGTWYPINVKGEIVR